VVAVVVKCRGSQCKGGGARAHKPPAVANGAAGCVGVCGVGKGRRHVSGRRVWWRAGIGSQGTPEWEYRTIQQSGGDPVRKCSSVRAVRCAVCAACGVRGQCAASARAVQWSPEPSEIARHARSVQPPAKGNGNVRALQGRTGSKMCGTHNRRQNARAPTPRTSGRCSVLRRWGAGTCRV